MNWLLFTSSLLLLALSVTADTCPGGKVKCPDFMTCCEISIDNFGCCPFPSAKCCSDRVHCCPHNMDCDIAHQSCTRNGVHLDWQLPVQPEMVEKVLPEETPAEVNDLDQFTDTPGVCPDKSACRADFTCCKMFSGKYGCCPFNNATCCKDGFHCCPLGAQCSASGECEFAEGDLKLNAYPLKVKRKQIKTLALKIPHQEVSDPGGVCPDGHPCPEKFTCCRINGKRFGCCPYTDAMCCDDGIHCCPKGTTCNTTLGTCDIQSHLGRNIPSQVLKPLQTEAMIDTAETTNEQDKTVNDVVCPDERYHCPSGTTCCEMGEGVYGCCMMEKAICCSDKKHCCPHDYTCHADGCQKGSNQLPPFLRARPAEKMSSEELVGKDVSSVICPDKYPCPDRNTCCQLQSGEYGCCPWEKGTCCADKIHCCPHKYSCVDGACRKQRGSKFHTLNAANLVRSPQETTVMDKNIDGHDVQCPDKTTSCPDGTTCCQLGDGSYGCCPYTDATCCQDKMHCCPHGYGCITEGCIKMPGMPKHLAPFLLKLFKVE